MKVKFIRCTIYHFNVRKEYNVKFLLILICISLFRFMAAEIKPSQMLV